MITEAPADRCDRCGAPAKTMAVLTSGSELLFCNHHATLVRATRSLTRPQPGTPNR